MKFIYLPIMPPPILRAGSFPVWNCDVLTCQTNNPQFLVIRAAGNAYVIGSDAGGTAPYLPIWFDAGSQPYSYFWFNAQTQIVPTGVGILGNGERLPTRQLLYKWRATLRWRAEWRPHKGRAPCCILAVSTTVGMTGPYMGASAPTRKMPRLEIGTDTFPFKPPARETPLRWRGFPLSARRADGTQASTSTPLLQPVSCRDSIRCHSVHPCAVTRLTFVPCHHPWPSDEAETGGVRE